jgi:hydroxymethylpyrimidine/phosphomethylpyrimidine kinase
MLFDADITRAVAETLRSHYIKSDMPPLICDPVCVSTSGHTLLHPQAIEIMIRELFPLTAVITPNKSEAELLLSHRNLSSKIADLGDMLLAAKNLSTLGPGAVLLKGGHIVTTMDDVRRVSAEHPGIDIMDDGVLGENMEILLISEKDPSATEIVVDVLYHSEGNTTIFLRPRINSTSTHGTGCTLSAALACELGRGISRLFMFAR